MRDLVLRIALEQRDDIPTDPVAKVADRRDKSDEHERSPFGFQLLRLRRPRRSSFTGTYERPAEFCHGF